MDLYARILELLNALTSNPRIRIDICDIDLHNYLSWMSASVHGRCPSPMATRLKIYVKRCPFGIGACCVQGMDFSVWCSCFLVVPFTDNLCSSFTMTAPTRVDWDSCVLLLDCAKSSARCIKALCVSSMAMRYLHPKVRFLTGLTQICIL